jgi:hypothetical protein
MSVETHTDAGQFNWMLANFVRGTDGVRDAVAVSSDGLLIATSDGLDRTGADQLAAIVSSMSSLGRSASKKYDFDGLKLIMIEMRRGFLLVSAINGGACLGALHWEESCGGHFREEHQTEDGEALRDDERFAYVAAWAYAGSDRPPVLHKEPLSFEYVHLAQRSYK